MAILDIWDIIVLGLQLCKSMISKCWYDASYWFSRKTKSSSRCTYLVALFGLSRWMRYFDWESSYVSSCAAGQAFQCPPYDWKSEQIVCLTETWLPGFGELERSNREKEWEHKSVTVPCKGKITGEGKTSWNQRWKERKIRVKERIIRTEGRRNSIGKSKWVMNF